MEGCVCHISFSFSFGEMYCSIIRSLVCSRICWRLLRPVWTLRLVLGRELFQWAFCCTDNFPKVLQLYVCVNGELRIEFYQLTVVATSASTSVFEIIIYGFVSFVQKNGIQSRPIQFVACPRGSAACVVKWCPLLFTNRLISKEWFLHLFYRWEVVIRGIGSSGQNKYQLSLNGKIVVGSFVEKCQFFKAS